MKIKTVDKRQKKLIKEENNKKRNGSWAAFRPSTIPQKTEYRRKGRRISNKSFL